MQIRKFWIVILAIVLVVSTVSLSTFIYDQLKLDRRDEALEELDRNIGQYDEQSIILYNISKTEAKELAALYGAKLRIAGNGRFATLTLPDGKTIRDIYADDSCLSYIDSMAADYQVQVSELSEDDYGQFLPQRPRYSVNDQDYELQTYLDYLNMGDVWNHYLGDGVAVAVIDTGIDTDHPEFVGRISPLSYNASEDKIVKDTLLEDGTYNWSIIEDEAGHGTSVTGVLAASMNSGNVVGIAPNVDIVVIKADCDSNGNFKRVSDLVFGLYYAIEVDVQVVNMSFSTKIDAFADAVKLAYDSDVICVAAAGNNSTSTMSYPAANQYVIGVGALEDGLKLEDYSNYGENVDIMAPGGTYTCKVGGGYGASQGTSLAAPIVSGAIALYMQTQQYATFDEVAENLYASCRDLGVSGRDWYYGFGALDISAFLIEDRGTIIYDMLTDELDNQEGVYIQGHTLQELPEPERLYAVFDGWYYDDSFTQEYEYYEDAFWGDSVTLYAKWTNEDDGVPYTYVTLDDGTVEIRSYNGHRRYITIPEMIEGKMVSSIGDFAFAGQTHLREVNLPSGLTRIGIGAFSGCSNILSMIIPEKVTVIERNAFEDNTRLSVMAFEGNSKLTTIGNFAFAGCAFERIELPAELSTVDGSAFFGNLSLENIVVKGGNDYFYSDDGVLLNRSGSTLVAYPAGHSGRYTLPESVRMVGSYAFSYSSLRQIDLQNILNIGTCAFAYSSLETVIIPDSVSNLERCAFKACASLSEVSIGKGLTLIPDTAFEMCPSLKEITIPNTVISIGSGCFAMSGLEKLNFENGSSLRFIGSESFKSCNLTRIQIPNSVIRIDGFAFSGNPLSDVSFTEDSQLNSIGANAFEYCVLLENIHLPKNLRVIENTAFMNTGLTSVTIPASVMELGNGVFSECRRLSNITVEADNKAYQSIDGVLYTMDELTIHTYPAGKPGNSYAILNGTQVVAPMAFSGVQSLKTVMLPDSLTQIEEYGFAYCGKLQKIHIPDNVIQIGQFAFAENWNMKEVSFGQTAKLPRISYGAFACCGIESFRIPSSVSSVGQRAFAGCENLNSVTFANNSKLESLSAYTFAECDYLKSITFESGSALKNIQAHALDGVDSLERIDFGDAKVTNVDNFAFRFCESLSEIELPKTVRSIGRYAFYGCKSLQELTVPEQVEHIGYYAFLATKDLELYFEGELLPVTLDENWDHGTKGYYTGVSAIKENGEYQYAVLESGNIAILKYLGNKSYVDLTNLDLGGSIVTIGVGAFKDSSVQKIILPESLTQIQAEAFAHCDLQEITIPAGVTFIGREAFYNTDICAIMIAKESNLSVIEQYAFARTEKLKQIQLPSALTTMGTGVFAESGLEMVHFEAGIKIQEIPQMAFEDTALAELALPDSVCLINHNAFRNVQTLKSVSYGNSENIRLMSSAFYRTGLTDVYIPANISYIGEYCFVGLKNLVEFTVDEQNPNYTAVDGLLMSKDGRKLIAVPAGRTGSLTVPNTIEEIGFGAFEESKLSDVLFDPDANILTFGHRAFFKAENITSIRIPNTVVSVDYYAFAYCENLREVIFAPETNLKGIYEGAFLGCGNLERIILPDSIVEISDFAFYGCEKITKIPVSEGHNLKGIYSYAFAYSGLKGDFTAPETLIDIGDYAFLGCDFTKITIPDANKKELTIGIGAFEDCNHLTEITLPFLGASFENEQISWFGYIFGAGAYYANNSYVPESLKTVTITDGLTMIGTGGFHECTSLEEIHIPHSVNTLYDWAFAYTTARYELTNIITTYHADDHRTGAVASWVHFGNGLCGNIVLSDEITTVSGAFENCKNLVGAVIPDSVTEIGSRTFSGCTSLESVVLPKNLTNIESFAFMSCEKLNNIIIPDGVTSIGENAFYGCTSLENIDIPGSVTNIDRAAFYQCVNLATITIPDNMISIEEFTFGYCQSLAKAVIGSNIQHIGAWAFTGCELLYEVINRSTLPLECGSEDHGLVSYYAKKLVNYGGDIQTNGHFIDTQDGFRFVVEDGEYTLVAYLGNEETITLPNDFDGHHYRLHKFMGGKNVIIPDGMTVIAESAFENNKFVEQIIIPDTVTSINDFAFKQCTALRNIIISEGVKTIGQEVFFGCSNLDSVAIPDSVTEMGDSLFYGCDQLKNVKLPDGITQISDNMFSYCHSLETFVVPDGVTEIGKYAFHYCEQLRSVSIPDGVTTIEENAFYQSDNIKSISIPDSVRNIGAFAFSSHTDVLLGKNSIFKYINGILYSDDGTQILHISKFIPEHLVLPDGIKTIDENAFSDITMLKSIVIPESVDYIRNSAFSGCTNLERVILPKQVELFGSNMFNNCCSLKEVVLPENIDNIGGSMFSGCTSLRNIDIPNNVTVICGYAFNGCTDLNSINLSNSLTSIGPYAFRGCINLESINFTKSLISIGDHAFRGCRNLRSVVLKEGVDSIGASAFEGCESLKSIALSDHLTSIGSYAFSFCNSLESITIPGSVASIGQNVFYQCGGLRHVCIEQGVETIESEAFMHCEKLETLEIADSVRTIGDRAFFFASNLRMVKLPKNLTTIGEEAFAYAGGENGKLIIYNNSSLDLSVGSEEYGDLTGNAGIIINAQTNEKYYDENYSITEDGFVFQRTEDGYQLVAYLGEEDTITLPTDYNGNSYEVYRLWGAKNVIIPYGMTHTGSYGATLESIVIPDSVTQINDIAFINSLLQSVVIPNSVTTIGVGAFSGCSRLESVTIPDSVTSIGGSAFYSCSNLESISIPEYISCIETGTFADCTNLKNITLPHGLLSIGAEAFARCGDLESIDIPETVTMIGHSAFNGCRSLKSIAIPDSVIKIGFRVFDETGIYKDSANWVNGTLIVDGWLIEVNHNCMYLPIWSDYRGFADILYDGSYSLIKNVLWYNDYRFEAPPNAQTVIINRILKTDFQSEIQPSITLKNIVIMDSVESGDLRHAEFAFKNLTGVTIFVEQQEADLRWDDNYPGWNNGNRVVYGDDWCWVNFYNEKGDLIYSEPHLNSEVIRLPVYNITVDGTHVYEISGWDLDGDGVADSIPATTATDVHIKPIVVEKERLYTIQFVDSTTGKIYEEFKLPMGASIPVPKDPHKKGHDFLNWDGFHGGMTVKEDLVIYASWDHHGTGHQYAAPVWVDAACTEPGFWKYVCLICDEYYGTGYTDPLGHDYIVTEIQPNCTEGGYSKYTCKHCSDTYVDELLPETGHKFGSWTIDRKPNCSEYGSQHRDCERCGYSESSVIYSTGHRLVVESSAESTCTIPGKQVLRCEDCQTVIEETAPLKEHRYEKKYASMSFIQWLLRLLMDILWGYEGDRPYYYACQDCGHVMCMSESQKITVGVASTACDHSQTAWKVLQEPSGTMPNVEASYCDQCGELLTIRTLGDYCEHNYSSVVISPTCTEEGYTTYTCAECGHSYITDYTDASGHAFINGVCHCGKKEYRAGDADGNGVVDNIDAMLILQYFVRLIDSSKIRVEVCDMDGDGYITNIDAMIVLQIFVGLRK